MVGTFTIPGYLFLITYINANWHRWHIFTAIGAYIFIAVVDHLVSGDDHNDLDALLAWPAPWAARSVFAGKECVKEEEFLDKQK